MRRIRSMVAVGAVGAFVAVAPTPLATARPAADHAPSSTTTITLDGAAPGRVFDGVGGVSASSSKLLYDYPEPQRSEILDYLFKPNFGASLDILKVEIGGDTNSTTTAEPSHMRTPTDLDCHRGIEWWLMKQAEKRNPNIELVGLMWGAPGWLSGMYTQDHVDYISSWLECARSNGLHIDAVGGANERGGTPEQFHSFYIALDKKLQTAAPDTKIIATDEHHPPDYWRVADQMASDPEFSDAVDVIGEHDVCVWLSTYQHCTASQNALDSGKPLWNSEQSSAIDGDGADALARALNRNYLDAKVTAVLNWGLTSGFYPDTATGGTGMMITQTPWSGAYDETRNIWVDAQTTQFTQPGWRYLDSASGYLPGGASYVTLRSPKTGDYTTVVETTDSTSAERVQLRPTGGLSTGTVHEWSTDLASNDPNDWFVHSADRAPAANGTIAATLRPNHIYTFSTTTGQHHGKAHTKASEATQLAMPFRENFEHVDSTGMARYFQDVQGAFQTAPCTHGRNGTCYRQEITQAPIPWHSTLNDPTTIVGDPRWWGDYDLSVDAMLEQPGYVDLVGRIENYDSIAMSGYHFQITDTGTWKVFSEDEANVDTVLATGTTKPLPVGTWHRLALRFSGATISPVVDGRVVGRIEDAQHRTGQVGLGVSPYQNAEFDNVRVAPVGQEPQFIPHSSMSAVATSEAAQLESYHRRSAEAAIDDRVESQWKTQFAPASTLPQSITLDLRRVRPTAGLAYKPPFDKRSGTVDAITGYTVSLSSDGVHFHQVASGTWAQTMATKTVTWARSPTRYIRLTATSSASGFAAASEINVSTTPFAAAGTR